MEELVRDIGNRGYDGAHGRGVSASVRRAERIAASMSARNVSRSRLADIAGWMAANRNVS